VGFSDGQCLHQDILLHDIVGKIAESLVTVRLAVGLELPLLGDYPACQ
jgi:hypothetical protein